MELAQTLNQIATLLSNVVSGIAIGLAIMSMYRYNIVATPVILRFTIVLMLFAMWLKF